MEREKQNRKKRKRGREVVRVQREVYLQSSLIKIQVCSNNYVSFKIVYTFYYKYSKSKVAINKTMFEQMV